MTPIMRKIAVSAVAVLAAGVVLFAAYAAYDYAETTCHADMRQAGLDRETAQILETVTGILTGLQRGAYPLERWPDEAFQQAVADALKIAKAGRVGLKRQQAFAALGSLSDLQPRLARAKSLATDRVNDIMKRQDPRDPGEFERLRLEGKNLVATVKQIDAALETVDSRTKRLPEMCNWSL